MEDYKKLYEQTQRRMKEFIKRWDGIKSMDSITEEEKKEYEHIAPGIEIENGVYIPNVNQIEWLNAHHFDYRGLIERGLALEAPEGMYK